MVADVGAEVSENDRIRAAAQNVVMDYICGTMDDQGTE